MSRGVCVITGGGRGIGAATARRAAAAGWSVCLSFLADASAATAVANEVGGRAVRAEMADERDVVALFESADEMGSVTAAVANAGIVGPALRVDEMSVERIRRMFDVNVLGVMLTAREAVRRMSTRHGGSGAEIHGSGGQPDRAHQIGPTTPMQRAGTADEVAAAIMWLLSDEASYTTGTILEVGGGR